MKIFIKRVHPILWTPDIWVYIQISTRYVQEKSKKEILFSPFQFRHWVCESLLGGHPVYDDTFFPSDTRYMNKNFSTPFQFGHPVYERRTRSYTITRYIFLAD